MNGAFYCFTTSSSLSRQNNLQLVSKYSNSIVRQPCGRDRILVHKRMRKREWERIFFDRNRKVSTSTECVPISFSFFHSCTRKIDFFYCMVFSFSCHHFDGYTRIFLRHSFFLLFINDSFDAYNLVAIGFYRIESKCICRIYVQNPACVLACVHYGFYSTEKKNCHYNHI